MQERLLAIAQMLLDDGYVDNEPDARLAALQILMAASHVQVDSAPPPPPELAAVG
jgi:hypothetical protein